jgi:protein-tyrosine phosphatase
MTTTHSLRLAGAPNFRDIGEGIVMRDGRRLRRNQVFRSGELSRLTDADLDALRRAGVKFVLDLRSPQECELHRSRWPDSLDTEFHRANIHPDIQINGRSALDLIKENPTGENIKFVAGAGFGPLADFCGPSLKQLVDRLVQGKTPVVFHCTNGRDRTGTVSAMLLYLLGAPREAIVADFMLTNERIDVELVVENSLATFRKALGLELDRKTVEQFTLVHPEYIDRLFELLDERYGSTEGYLQHYGIDEGVAEAVRERLLA